MADFKFLHDSASNKWIISAPRRAKRPDVAKEVSPLCPFCVGNEDLEAEIYRVGGEKGDQNWQIRVIPNKFPFAPIHELVIHSPDHHKNIGELPLAQVELIFQVYKNRFNAHRNNGQVYIFNNRGEAAGESLPHPHTQIVVIPKDVRHEIPMLTVVPQDKLETSMFDIFCPATSQWPDEVWITPKKSGRMYGDISDEELKDLSFVMQRLIMILDLRHGHEFPMNFYIYPGNNWYIRLIPRVKTLGGFELGTDIFVNTQDPNETLLFLKKHFDTFEKHQHITEHHPADYAKSV